MVYGILGLILSVFAGVYFWGSRLPGTQEVTRDVLINAPGDCVWATMTDYLRQVEWRSDLVSVEMSAGQQAWTERPRKGWPTACCIARQEPGRLLEIEQRPLAPFSGSRTATLEEAAQATRLTVTEISRIPNPFARVWLRAFLDPAASLQRYGRDLKQRAEARHSSNLSSPLDLKNGT